MNVASDGERLIFCMKQTTDMEEIASHLSTKFGFSFIV